MEVSTQEAPQGHEIAAEGIGDNRNIDPDTLRSQKAALEEELREAFLDGNPVLILKLKRQLSRFDDLILAAEVGSAVGTLDSLMEQITDIKGQNEELMRLRAEQNKVLREKLDAAQEVQDEVSKIDFAIASCNMQLESLRIGRNEIKDRLNDLWETETAKGEKNNERF